MHKKQPNIWKKVFKLLHDNAPVSPVYVIQDFYAKINKPVIRKLKKRKFQRQNAMQLYKNCFRSYEYSRGAISEDFLAMTEVLEKCVDFQEVYLENLTKFEISIIF